MTSGYLTRSMRLFVGCSLLAAACSGGGGSPTSPTPGGDPGVDRVATIRGRVRSSGDTGGGSSPIVLTVSIVGSSVSTPVDASGHFTLEDVQPGSVQLRFTGPGVDALLDIGPVQAGQVITVDVTVNGSDATLESPPDSGEDAHLEGALTSLGGACPNVTFRVNGTLIHTSAATIFDDGGCAALDNGDRVRVDGVQQPDGSVQATEVEVDEPADDGSDDDPPGGDAPDDGDEDDGEVHPEGTVTSLGGACPNVTFRVDGTPIRTSAATMFDDGGCAALENGDRVRIDGVQQPDGSVQATEVEVDEPADDGSDDDPPGGDAPDDGDEDDGEVHPEGTVTSLGGACPNVTFRVDGTPIRTSAATMFDDGGCAALENGDHVRVDGHQQPDGSVQATEVEVDEADDDPETVALDLEIDPDDWRLEWAEGGQSGGGGANVRVRISGSGASQIDLATIEMSGPTGTISPVSTEVDDELEAEFSKVEAIGLIGGAQDGDTVRITVQGRLADGTLFSLEHDATIRE